MVVTDEAHSSREERFLALGRTAVGRRVLVAFTLRGTLIRVISARPMSRREREVYAEAEAQDEADPAL